ncbi:MAG: outer membrane protein assembly factor BamA [Phycisphaerales bacterium]
MLGALSSAAIPCAHLATLTLPVPAALAQPADDPNESRPIRAIRIVVPQPDGSLADLAEPMLGQAINNIRSYPGAPYRRATVDNDIRRLNRLGTFSSVESAVQRLDTGSVDLIFTVVPRPVIVDVQVSGNTRLSDQELAGQVDLLAGTPIDRFQVDRAARRIEELYREEGFYFAQVTLDEEVLEESNIVLFTIREGERVKVTDLRFEGNTAFEPRELRRELETKTANILRRGQLDDDKLDADITGLIVFYRDAGYLDVRADRLIQPSPNGKEAIVTYVIDEGPLYTLRSVEFEVETATDEPPVYDRPQIAGLIDIKPGDAFGVKALTDSLNTIARAYGQMGYTDVQVTRVERRDPDAPLVDLIIRVSEGNRYKTGEVIVSGNYLTKQNVVRRHVEVRPERPLDNNAIEDTERRLRRLNLFNFAPNATRITLQPPDPREPDYRDVLVEVEETNTGDISIGGAVSSDSGVVGRIAITQRNFDLFDTPDSPGEFFTGRAFRGAGQTFSFEVLPGDQVQTYSISLSDPYLLETDYSGNVSVFYRNRDFDEFDEERYGTRFGFGRRFGTRWNGNLGFRVEAIELSDLEPERPTDIFDVADQNVLSTVSFSLSRNTLDSPYRPTRGATSRVSIEQAGLTDFTYTKFGASHRVFIPIREDYLGRSTVFSIGSEVGYVPQDEDEIPTYERFYLGGQSFRGFDFRTVSPRGIRNDNGLPSDDSVGGTWLFFLGAEINQPIFEDVFSVVAFVDSGTVTNDPGFDDYRVSVGFGFRFYVQALSPAPLAFDFGFPIVEQDGDESRLFTFTVDLPF